jgi:hypothetical protein
MTLTGHDNKEAQPAGSRFEWKQLVRLCTAVALAAAALNTGWVFWSRYESNRAMDEQLREKQRAEAARVVENLGGTEFQILSFYASPGIITRGETAQICYGVANAKSVRIEPEVGETWPSYGRCMDVSPIKDTTYTLTAEDAAGHSLTSTLTLRVQ